MKRIVGILALIAGLATLIATVVVVNTQEKETTLSLSIPASQSAFVYTAPGVLDILGDDVTVTIRAEGEQIQWGLGTAADVEAYLADASATEIIGLESWEALATQTHEGTPEGAEEIASATEAGTLQVHTSDMWRMSGEGEGEVVETIAHDPQYSASLIVTTSTGTAPEVELQWTYEKAYGSPVAWYVIGALLTLIGAFFILTWYQDAKAASLRQGHRPSSRIRRSAGVAIAEDDGDNLDADSTRELQRVTTDAGYGAAILPGTARAEEFRTRELAEEDRLVIPVAQDEDAQDEAGQDEAGQDEAGQEEAGQADVEADGDNKPSEDDAVQADVAQADAVEPIEAEVPEPETTEPELTEPEVTVQDEDHDIPRRPELRHDRPFYDEAASAELLFGPDFGSPETADVVVTEDADAREDASVQDIDASAQDIDASAQDIEATHAEVSDNDSAGDDPKKDDDWRSLWNFSWGTPWKKEGGKDA
ncbi:MAG: hypothetical protein GX483_07890 [Actinomycetaceae bacterium]|nr:hypothetical protein [Actinomycetaceae bacterium]